MISKTLVVFKMVKLIHIIILLGLRRRIKKILKIKAWLKEWPMILLVCKGLLVKILLSRDKLGLLSLLLTMRNARVVSLYKMEFFKMAMQLHLN